MSHLLLLLLLLGAAKLRGRPFLLWSPLGLFVPLLALVAAANFTVAVKVKALQVLKNSLGLPLRFGWNGDPCVPQQHPWSGVDCQNDGKSGKWVIDGLDLSYNMLNGSIPESLGQLASLRILNLNGNFLEGRVPAALGGRPLHRASFNFTGNAGLCGIPGLPTCGPHLSMGAKIGIALGSLVLLLILTTCLACWWKRRQNIIRAQKIAAAREAAPYAKARTHHARDVQMSKQHRIHDQSRNSADSGPQLLA